MADNLKKLTKQTNRILSDIVDTQQTIRDGGVRYFTPHVKQAEFLQSCFDNRESWAFCGNRSGKSEAAATATVSMATGILPQQEYITSRLLNIKFRHRPGSIHWVCGESNEVLREVIQPKLLRLIPKGYLDGRPKMLARGVIDYIPFIKGSRIVFKNYEQLVEKFSGADVDSIWFDEEPPQDIYKECLMRTIDRGGHIFGALTPVNGLTWIYRDIYEKRHQRNIKVFNWDMDDNPFISDLEKGEILAGLTVDELRIRKKGEFVALHGLIYPMYDEDKHFIKDFDIPSHWPRVTATDPHLAKPISTVWMTCAAEDYKQYKRGDQFVYREMKKEGIATEIVSALKVYTGHERLIARLGDPSCNVTTKNYVGMNVFDEYAKLGWPMLPANKDVFGGIEGVRDKLGQSPPALYVFRSCPGVNYEFSHYRLKDMDNNETKNYSDKILQRNDDYLDPIRYIINSGLFTNRHKRAGQTRDNYHYSETGRRLGKRYAVA